MIQAVSVMAAASQVATATETPTQNTQRPPSFEALAARCAPQVHPATLKGIITTESSWNPYAIGVVGTPLARQPRSLPNAVATARALERQGRNFSLGYGQVNRYNLARFGERYDTIFDPCRNLKAAGAILTECYQRARKTGKGGANRDDDGQGRDEQYALRAAFSCYYSGNFTRGFRPDKPGDRSYVQKVIANAGAIPSRYVVPEIAGSARATLRWKNDESPTPIRTAAQRQTDTRWFIVAEPPSGHLPPMGTVASEAEAGRASAIETPGMQATQSFVQIVEAGD